MRDTGAILSANWHITSRCNYRCRFCFAREMGPETTHVDTQLGVMKALRAFGIEKLNLVGGEPLLHPDILDLVRMAKDLGFTVSLQTNGSLMDARCLDEIASSIDWIGVSIDSPSESVESELGRGNGDHVSMTRALCSSIHDHGIRLKVNSTITSLNWSEDLHGLIDELAPHRWKVFQMLVVHGQNDDAHDLCVGDEQFAHFCARHSDIRLRSGASPSFETADDMVGSYLMISPAGMIMSNRGRRLRLVPLDGLSGPERYNFIDASKYSSRGGVYDW